MSEMQRSLSSLAKNGMDMDNAGMGYAPRAMNKATPAKMGRRESATVVVVEKDGKAYGGAMSYFLWFVVATIVAWFLLWALRPEWLRARHDEHDDSSDSHHRGHHDDHRHDHGRLFGAAIILGIIFVIFVWLFRWSCGNAW